MIDYKARQAAVDADPAYQQLEQAATKEMEETNEIKTELSRQTYKLQRLLYARDVLLEQMWKLEDTTDETDELLKDLTANNGEAWCGMTSQAIEDLQDVILDLCASVTVNRSQYIALDRRRRDAWAEAHARAAVVRKEYDAAQTKEA